MALPTGSDIAEELEGKRGPERDAIVMAHIRAGHLPSWLRSRGWRAVTRTMVLGGKSRTLTTYHAPDVVAVGISDGDKDVLRVPQTPADAQTTATQLGAVLATRKLIRDSYAAADVKLLLPVPINDAKGQPRHDTGAWVESNARIEKQLSGRNPGDHLTGGGKKAVVVGENLDGTRLAIYGGGGGKVDGHFWQPYSTIHDVSMGDFGGYDHDHSHGTYLVLERGDLDGMAVNIDRDIAQDPVLFPLVIDDSAKPYPLRFPNRAGTPTPLPPKLPSGFVPAVYPPAPLPEKDPDKPPGAPEGETSMMTKVIVGMLLGVVTTTGIVIAVRST